MGSRAERVVAVALYPVVAGAMAAGRSVEYGQLLAETAVEVERVLLERRVKRDARLLRRAQERICEAAVQLGAAAESRTASPGDVESDVERELRDLDMALAPQWHPEHPLHPEND